MITHSIWFVRKDISKSLNTWVDVDSPTIFLFYKYYEDVKKQLWYYNKGYY